ncbi:hypothetical protein EMMF5_001175 [Cystobasidiomycetes sp. EMM_F5]
MAPTEKPARSAAEALPFEVLFQIFSVELPRITTHRERLNDLSALSLVSRKFRPAAQAALLSHVFIRAVGRASLLSAVLRSDPKLSKHVQTVAWTDGTRRANPRILADLLTLAKPAEVVLGDGFYSTSRNSQQDVGVVLNALSRLQPFTSFSYGSHEQHLADTSLLGIQLISAPFKGLQRLELIKVVWPGQYNVHLWHTYPPPEFQLKHLGVDDCAFMTYSEETESWLHWILVNSVSSLRSLRLNRIPLSDPKYDDARVLLAKCAPNLLSLATANPPTDAWGLTGEDNRLWLHSTNLLSYTTNLGPPDFLENKVKLQYLEVHSKNLHAQLRAALRNNILPALRHIVLVDASPSHPDIHEIQKHCKSNEIALTLRRE